MTVSSVPNRKPCNVQSSRNAKTGWDLNLGQTLQQSPLVCSVYDSDRYKTTMSFWSTLANNLCVSLFTVDVRQDAGSRQSDGWSEDLLTSNNIFQKQLASSFFFGLWQTVFMGWIPKHLVINYGVDNVLCCLIFFKWSQHFLPQLFAKQYAALKSKVWLDSNRACNITTNKVKTHYCKSVYKAQSLPAVVLPVRIHTAQVRRRREQIPANTYRWAEQCSSKPAATYSTTARGFDYPGNQRRKRLRW